MLVRWLPPWLAFDECFPPVPRLLIIVYVVLAVALLHAGILSASPDSKNARSQFDGLPEPVEPLADPGTPSKKATWRLSQPGGCCHYATAPVPRLPRLLLFHVCRDVRWPYI